MCVSCFRGRKCSGQWPQVDWDCVIHKLLCSDVVIALSFQSIICTRAALLWPCCDRSLTQCPLTRWVKICYCQSGELLSWASSRVGKVGKVGRGGGRGVKSWVTQWRPGVSCTIVHCTTAHTSRITWNWKVWAAQLLPHQHKHYHYHYYYYYYCSPTTSTSSRPPPLSAIARVLTGSITPATRFTQRPGVFILFSQRWCRFSIGVLRPEMDSCLLICFLHILPFRIVIKNWNHVGIILGFYWPQC